MIRTSNKYVINTFVTKLKINLPEYFGEIKSLTVNEYHDIIITSYQGDSYTTFSTPVREKLLYELIDKVESFK